MGAAVEPKDFGFPQEENVPLRRPNRTRPLTNEELRLIAAQNPPPAEWFEGEEPERKFAHKPHWFLRFYRMLRKLVRQRQESKALKSEKRAALAQIRRADAAAEAAIENARLSSEATARAAKVDIEQIRAAAASEIAAAVKHLAAKDAELSELRQQMERRVGTLEEMLRSREKDIKSYADLQIPKLERELQVERSHVQYLETLIAKKLAHEEAQIAVDNRKIIDSEGLDAEEKLKSMRSFLSGQMGVTRQGG